MPAAAQFQSHTSRYLLDVDGTIIPLIACTLPEIHWDLSYPPVPHANTPVLGAMRLEPLQISFSPTSNPLLERWISAMGSDRRDASAIRVLRADANSKLVEDISLSECVLTELRFPECAATNKNTFTVEAEFQPEIIKFNKASGTLSQAIGSTKRWMSENYALRFGALPCQRVSRIGPFSIKRILSEDTFTGREVTLRQNDRIRHSTLDITVSAADEGPWRTLLDKLLHAGTGSIEQTATLDFFDQTMKTVVGSFSFDVVGLTAYKFGSGAATDQIQSFSVSLALASVKFKAAHAD